MKNLRKILRTLFVFFIMLNSIVYAETEMLSQEKIDMKKTVVLGAGIFLIVQILFISYKLDKEPNKKRVNHKNKKKENHVVKENTIVQQDFEAQKEDKDLFIKLKLEKAIETFSNDEIKKQELEKQKFSQKKVVEIDLKDKEIDKINEKKESKIRDIKEIEETRKKIIRMVEEARRGATKVTEEAKKEAVETKKETRKKTIKTSQKSKRKK